MEEGLTQSHSFSGVQPPNSGCCADWMRNKRLLHSHHPTGNEILCKDHLQLCKDTNMKIIGRSSSFCLIFSVLLEANSRKLYMGSQVFC